MVVWCINWIDINIILFNIDYYYPEFDKSEFEKNGVAWSRGNEESWYKLHICISEFRYIFILLKFKLFGKFLRILSWKW